MNRKTFKGIRLAAALYIALTLLAVPAAGIVSADTPTDATSLTLTVANSVQFGQNVHLSAKLVDAADAPIAGVKVTFVEPETFFLGTTGDVLIGEVQTDKDGVAETDFQARDSGSLNVRAEFRGNDHYAASRATGQFVVDDTARQLYIQQAGVQVPGLDVAPGQQTANAESGASEAIPAPTGLATLWPSISAWPVILVLLTVWSLYAAAVRQLFRIASAKPEIATAPRRRGWIVAGGSQEASEQGSDYSRLWRKGDGQ